MILAIDVKEEEGTVAAFANELEATFPLGLDSDGAAQAAWDATALPVHFWVDTEGIVRDGALGGIGSDIMARGVGDDPAGRRGHALSLPPPKATHTLPPLTDGGVATARVPSTRAEIAAALDRAGRRPRAAARRRRLRRDAGCGLARPGRRPYRSRRPARAPAAGRHRRRRPGRLHVAILTGRTVADVAARARVGGIEYLGDHGLQSAWLDRGRAAAAIARHRRARVRRPTASRPRPWRRASRRSSARPPWLFVERKGASVAFHVRQADDIPVARAAVFDAIATVEARLGLAGHGLRPYRGRSVVDLRPSEAGGKREAVERLIARHRPGAVVSLGDDLSDADAFDAVLAERDAGPTDGLTVAVHGRLRRAAGGARAGGPRRRVGSRRRAAAGARSLAGSSESR